MTDIWLVVDQALPTQLQVDKGKSLTLIFLIVALANQNFVFCQKHLQQESSHSRSHRPLHHKELDKQPKICQVVTFVQS